MDWWLSRIKYNVAIIFVMAVSGIAGLAVWLLLYVVIGFPTIGDPDFMIGFMAAIGFSEFRDKLWDIFVGK